MNITTPAVRDILDAVVGCLVPGTRKVTDPVSIIRQRFSVSADTARKYLRRLADANMVTLSHMQGSLSHLFLAPEETLSRLVAALPPPPIPEPPRPRRAKPTGVSGATAVLVDVDNVVLGFKKEGLTVSFLKLKEYLRAALGIIGFCDAYVSPRSDSILVAALWDAGFDVIICPMGSKDKDAVDEKMRLRGLKYLLTTGIRQVAVVSRDSDFRPLVSEAADRGKKVILVNLTADMRELSGIDPAVAVPYSRPVQRFLDALECVRSRRPGSSQDTDCGFVTHVASLVRGDFRDSHDDRHPDAISKRVRARLLQKWRPSYLVSDIDAAIKALLESGALHRSGSSGLRLEDKNELWKHVP